MIRQSQIAARSRGLKLSRRLPDRDGREVHRIEMGAVVKEPSAKGLIVIMAMVPVKQAIHAGQIAREDVELRLGEHAEILDQKISPALWYPVDVTGVFHEIMAEQMPGPRQAALTDQGISAVRHLSQQRLNSLRTLHT